MNRPSRRQMKINSTLDTTVGGSCSGSPTSTSFVAAYWSGIRLSISVHWQACQQQQSLNDKNAAEYIRWIVKTMNKYISSLMPGCTIFNGVHMSQYCTSDIIRSVLITWQWPWFYFLFLPLVFKQKSPVFSSFIQVLLLSYKCPNHNILDTATCAFCTQCQHSVVTNFPSVLWHCWLGDRKGIQPVNKIWCWFVGGNDLTGALHDL